jgi:hypothetical protein
VNEELLQTLTPYIVFVVLASGLLFFASLILRRVTEYSTRLILLGIVLAVTAVGFGTLTPAQRPASDLAETLMRLAVLLVVGGVVHGFFFTPKPPNIGSARRRK